jgi:hypothetical protein
MLRDAVPSIADLLRTGSAIVAEVAGLPARQLASFMDDVDEVWVVDAFLDQPDRFELGR